MSPPTRGAWIEISIGNWHSWRRTRRPPHGGRGLKFPVRWHRAPGAGRPPHGGRGLKFTPQQHNQLRQKSPPTRGAWIEIARASRWASCLACRPPHGGRGLKYLGSGAGLVGLRGRPPHGGRGLKFDYVVRGGTFPEVAPHTGGVD